MTNTKTKFNNAIEFLNAIYSDLTNTSDRELHLGDLDNLIAQFKEFDLGTDKLEQLSVFVANKKLFGYVDVNHEVRKFVGKTLQLLNTPQLDIKRSLWLAICQDVYDAENKAVKSLQAQIQCLDPDGEKGLYKEFLSGIGWANELYDELEELLD